MTTIKLILENSAGKLGESKPMRVHDVTDVFEETLRLLADEDWALAPGDMIRIVKA